MPLVGPGEAKKKADAVEHSVVFRRVGLLGDESPGIAELLFIQSSNTLKTYLNGSVRDNKWQTGLLFC